jgi:predicted permease
MTEAEAVAEARRRFGDPDELRDAFARAEARRARRLSVSEWIDVTAHDLGYALRQFRNAPGFSASVILTLAFGIGANAAMFTVVDRVFLQAPPGVARPASVHRLMAYQLGYPNIELPVESFTTREHDAFRAATAGLAEVEGYDVESDAQFDGGAERHSVGYATTGFLHLSGVRPALGRFFDPRENEYGAPTNVAILNYSYWQRAYDGDSRILGRTIRIDSTLFTIIGVAPSGFDGVDLDAVDVWAPLASLPAGLEGPWWGDSGLQMLKLLVRVDRPRNESAVYARLKAEHLALRPGQAEDVEKGFKPRLEVEPLIQGRTSIGLGRQDDRNVALLTRLAGVSVLVLIIAVCNAASLLLMRALRRRREIAVRLALGVSHARLVAQFAGESVLLAGVAGAISLWIAYATGQALRKQLIADVHWSATLIDVRVVAFTAALALVAGVLAGMAPIAVVRSRDVMSALKEGARESGRPRSATRVALLATQTGLCMVMLSAAGMFLDSLWHASAFDFGLDKDRLATVTVPLANENEITRIVGEIRALPGVAAVARSTSDMRFGGLMRVRLSNGFETPRLDSPGMNHIDTSLVRVAGLRVLEGRPWLAQQDAADSVALINSAMARRYWAGRSPIGDCFTQLAGPSPRTCFRVIGVVKDVRFDLSRPAIPQYYIVSRTWRRIGMSSVVVRTSGPATPTIIADIQQVLRTIHSPSAYPPNPRLMSARLEPQVHPWRVAAAMFLAFGLLGLVAATAGIYGLMGYEVTQRTHEFGVRMALGATAESILALVLGSGLRLIVVGLAAGLALSLVVGRTISSLVFEISPYDPVVLSVTMVALAAVALMASLIPAWRATRVDPLVALRAE